MTKFFGKKQKNMQPKQSKYEYIVEELLKKGGVEIE